MKYVYDGYEDIERVTGEQLHLWPAYTPETLPKNIRIRLDPMKPQTYGSPAEPITEIEKAIWYSHFTLWEHIAETEAGWIFEHDADVSEEDVFDDIPESYTMAFGTSMANMHAYFLRPIAAKRLVDNITNFRVKGQIDTFIYDLLTYFKPADVNFCCLHYIIRQNESYGSTHHD